MILRLLVWLGLVRRVLPTPPPPQRTYTAEEVRLACRARNRHRRRHGNGPLALFLNLYARLYTAKNLREAEQRTRRYLRAHRKRFAQVVHPVTGVDEVLTVLRYELWPRHLEDRAAR